MGFTAINASKETPATASHASRGPDSKDATSSTTIASEYLGRGEIQAAAAPVAAKTRKVATKSKKRAAMIKESSKIKRRRSSNVDHRLHINKARPLSESNENIDQSTPAPQQASKGSKSKKKSSTAATQPKAGAHHVGDDHAEDIPSKAKPVSVYASKTSMDALDSTSARTSIDSVKANAGQSITVYQNPYSSISHQSNAEFSQPWLNDAADVQAKASKKNVTRKIMPKTKVPTNNVAVDATSIGIQRSARAEPEVNHAGHDGFIVIGDTESSDDAATRRRSTTSRRRTRSSDTIGAEDGFGDIDDNDLMESAMAIDDAIVNRPATPPNRGRKQNMRDVDEHEDYGGALLTNDELKLLAQLKTNESKKDPVDKPIVRKCFPKAIQDRSPLFGASNNTLLRTCFRVGEALNTGSQAVRSNKNVIIELYARVTSSWRDPLSGRKQHFVFKDLYHDKPPFLEGVYELWNQAQLWDLDSRPFVKATEQGMLARAIARMRREGQKWRLEMLGVWEASWEDVEHVAGICNGDVREDCDLEDE